MRRAALLAALLATAACRQIAGIQDLPQPCADPLMIDDMEDGDGHICEKSGRHGAWFVVGDGTSAKTMPAIDAEFKPTPIPGTRSGSRYAAYFGGSGFTDWGALMGLGLNVQGLAQQPYNANTAAGIKFWMKSNAPVWVDFALPATVPESLGGSCVASSPANFCNEHFQFAITAPSADWAQYELPFDALRRPGGPAIWKSSEILDIDFRVPPGAPFDLWIDDLTFYYKCGPLGCMPSCSDQKFPVACPKGASHPAGCFPPDTDCASIDGWCADPLLIDNLEDGDEVLCQSAGRTGSWWVFSDGTSTDLTPSANQPLVPTPIPGGRDGSHEAARLAGSGFTGWGAELLVRPNNDAAYDASAANGLKFWVKGNAAPLTVGIDTRATIPVSEGGSCVESEYCYDAFVFAFAPDPDRWQAYEIPFAAFRQPPPFSAVTGNVLPASVWDPSSLMEIKFSVQGAAATPPFEIWIDDLSFYTCSGASCVPTCGDPELPVACPATSDRPADCWPVGTDCAAKPDIVHSISVWGSGPNDVWAVGNSGVTRAGTVLHYDGAAWTRSDVGVAVPPLWDVTGSGADDLWIVGDHGTVLRRKGSAWSSTTADTDASLDVAWANGPSDAWTIGYPGTVRRWNGSTWSTSTSVNKVMFGLWASAPNDLWAVGEGGTILHFDGTAWAPKPSPTTMFLDRVWGSGPRDVWAVGESGPVLHFDGERWAASTSDEGVFLGVWGSGPNDVWAVGSAIAHWNGTVWTTLPNPAKYILNDVWGSAANDVWAVGLRNTILHFDGNAWTPVAITPGAP